MATFLKKKKKCDVVICVSHLGWDTDLDDDEEMIKGSRHACRFGQLPPACHQGLLHISHP